jgi:hypothetical protein
MGWALYPSQQRLLRERFQRVILLLDGDAAGQRATTEIAARLRPHCELRVIDLLPETQPDHMTSDQVWQVLRATIQPQRSGGCAKLMVDGGRARGHGKENPPMSYAVRPCRPIRVPSPRQLPTDHDCAIWTRGYQSDQPSHLPLPCHPLCILHDWRVPSTQEASH